MNIMAQLRQHANATARATQMIADAKSSRNEAAGDVGASYSGLRIEETVEWKAADEIERLRDALHKIASGYPCRDALSMMRVASDALGLTHEQAPAAPTTGGGSMEQGGISDRLSNFDEWGDRNRERS